MDHGHIDEHNLPERYVLGRLDEAEQASFEDHFAECPRCLEAVEVARELAAGLAAVDASAASEPPMAAVVPMRSRPRAAPRPLASAFPRWAAAALVALALLPSLWLARRNLDLAAEVESLRRPWASAPAAVLELTRDAANADVVGRVSAGRQPWIPLAVDLGDVAGLRVGVELYRGDGELLWTGTDLRAPESGPLTLSFPARMLTPGRYRMALSLAAEGRVEPAGEILFEVVP